MEKTPAPSWSSRVDSTVQEARIRRNHQDAISRLLSSLKITEAFPFAFLTVFEERDGKPSYTFFYRELVLRNELQNRSANLSHAGYPRLTSLHISHLQSIRTHKLWADPSKSIQLFAPAPPKPPSASNLYAPLGEGRCVHVEQSLQRHLQNSFSIRQRVPFGLHSHHIAFFFF